MTSLPKFMLKHISRNLQTARTYLTLEEARYFLSTIALKPYSPFQIFTSEKFIEIWHNASRRQVIIRATKRHCISAQKYLKANQNPENEIIPVLSIDDLETLLNWIAG